MTDHVGEAALTEFRLRLTGNFGLKLLKEHGGAVLVQLPVGVGKSLSLDLITIEAAVSGAYELVVVLAPTKRLIRERGPLIDPPNGVRVVELKSRPSEACRPKRDAQWKSYEAADLGALGRAQVCEKCPQRSKCFWPRQYGKALQGVQIIYATQTHLERRPSFLTRLASSVGSKRTLTLIDESDFAGKSLEESISADLLMQFIDTLMASDHLCGKPSWQHGQWLEMARMLLGASTPDLQESTWRVPFIQQDWAEVVQRVGVEQHGKAFRFIAYKLSEFCNSSVDTRRRGLTGDIQFATKPYVGDLMLFTATTDRDYISFRMGKELTSPFADDRFSHPKTRWFNNCSGIGTQGYFPKHTPQVLDFFAGLIARRAAEGKRIFLVAKKNSVENCATGLATRFVELGSKLEVITTGWSKEKLDNPLVIPLINYGMIGTNLFEEFDCAFCLNGYYVNEAVLNHCLQDVTRRDLRIPILLETVGIPKRRRARVQDPGDRFYDVSKLLQPALEFKEHGVVVQAVGRVRPFTRPREIITFQMAQLPGVVYNTEFGTLAAARHHFDVPSGRVRKSAVRTAAVALLRSQGFTQAEVATRLGISIRTVRNYEKGKTGKNTSSI